MDPDMTKWYLDQAVFYTRLGVIMTGVMAIAAGICFYFAWRYHQLILRRGGSRLAMWNGHLRADGLVVALPIYQESYLIGTAETVDHALQTLALKLVDALRDTGCCPVRMLLLVGDQELLADYGSGSLKLGVARQVFRDMVVTMADSVGCGDQARELLSDVVVEAVPLAASVTRDTFLAAIDSVIERESVPEVETALIYSLG